MLNVNRPQSFRREAFEEVRQSLPPVPAARLRVGMGMIFSYLDATNDEVLVTSLKRFLELASATDTPVLVQLDGESWWQARPDLWNWFDPAQPGFNPENRQNVEWSGWSAHEAIKLSWRNWGRQIRTLPPPNLMSERYRKACHEKMQLLIPIILNWWKALPDERKDLLVGVKLGWESSIGVSNYYYPQGNALLDRPAAEDSTHGLKPDDVPSRGVAQIGYAAVKTAGLRAEGQITEADLTEIARRHLEDLCAEAARLGAPREKLFTHGGGWKDGEMLYQAAVNRHSCPGWSFYRHAGDPPKDTGVQHALNSSDAPYWAACEWLFQGPPTVAAWRAALKNTLADPRCRFLCIYNFEGIRKNDAALAAIREVVGESVPAR